MTDSDSFLLPGPSCHGTKPGLEDPRLDGRTLWWGSHEGSWGTSLQEPKAGGRLDFWQPVSSQGSVPTERCLTLCYLLPEPSVVQ